jgi:hypothetical protein
VCLKGRRKGGFFFRSESKAHTQPRHPKHLHRKGKEQDPQGKNPHSVLNRIKSPASTIELSQYLHLFNIRDRQYQKHRQEGNWIFSPAQNIRFATKIKMHLT